MKVLVALDESHEAESAVTAIASWARAAGVEVVLCTVVHPSQIHETVSSSGFAHAVTPQGSPSGQVLPGIKDPAHLATAAEDRTQALVRAHAERRDHLAKVASRHLADVAVEFHVRDGADTAGEIVAAAEEAGADFIALAARGRSALGQALFGAVHEDVVRRSPVPVLLAGPGVRALAKPVTF
jgi:nucleotide-binding universal stress UspA family protein